MPTFSDEQRSLAEVAGEVFAKAARLRERWEGADVDAWPQVARLGLDAAGPVDLVLVLEEVGRSGLPEPVAETYAVAAALLPEAVGRATLALASEPFVVDADRADVVLVERAGRLEVVRDVAASRVPSEDRARRLFTVEAGPGEPLATDALADARTRARWSTAGVLNGVSRKLLALSVEHARTREQFGRPIGSFQAVAHRLADAHVAVEAARGAAWAAAHDIAAGSPDGERAARVAKAAAADAGALVNTTALQVHGGIGFTWEHDLHLWLKRGKALEAAYGSAREHRAALWDDLAARAGTRGRGRSSGG